LSAVALLTLDAIGPKAEQLADEAGQATDIPVGYDSEFDLEWRMSGTYTPIDGRSKPNRKAVVNAAVQDTALPPSLRAQVPQSLELAMDFRNNRNAAHLGNVDASEMDATCVVQTLSWVIGEVARLESQKPASEIQEVLDQLAAHHVPLIQKVGDTPIVLSPGMRAADKALVLLYQHGEPVHMSTLRTWAEYKHSTNWRRLVVASLQRDKRVYVDGEGMVHLLRPGEAEAQRILSAESEVI
jgi:hypothetical protein